MRQLHLDRAQPHNHLLWADLPTSWPLRLLWFELILSISPAQKQPVRSGSITIAKCSTLSHEADPATFDTVAARPFLKIDNTEYVIVQPGTEDKVAVIFSADAHVLAAAASAI